MDRSDEVHSPQQVVQTGGKALLDDRAKSLDELLEQISLTDEEIDDIRAKTGTRTIRDAALGTFRITQVANEFLKWNENVEYEIREKKKSYLIEKYLHQTEINEKSIRALKETVANPYGHVLFSKIMGIVDNSPPDQELFDHLAKALTYISDTDFENLFEQHKYAISQIESLTPQALSILANFKQWPEIQLGSSSTIGGKLTSDYNDEFATAFAQSKGIASSEKIERIKHSVGQLIGSRFIESYKVAEHTFQCSPTSIGKSLLPYIHDPY